MNFVQKGFEYNMENTLLKSEKQKITLPMSVRDTVCTAICFFMSMASVIGNINPFGIAFYAACFSMTGRTYCFLAFCIGTLIGFSNLNAFKYIICAALITFVFKIFSRWTGTIKKAVITSVVLLVVSVVVLIVRGFLLYDFMLCILEALMCFASVYILDGAVPLAISYKNRSYLSAQEMLSIICLFSFTVLGLSVIPAVEGLKISNIVAILLILMLNLKGEMMAGAAIGVIFGLIASIGTYNTGAVVGAYAFASLLCGLFKKYSRLGVILGFTLANAIITAFINSSSEVLINVYETIIASVLFIIMPQKIVDYFSEFPQKTLRCATASFSGKDRMQYVVYSNLKEMSEAFDKSYRYMKPQNDEISKTQLKSYIDMAMENSCKECGGRFRCWQTNCQKTYVYMGTLFEIAEECGSVVPSQMPKEFKNICKHPDAVTKSFNTMYNLYKTEKIWAQRLAEAKVLMAEQMKCISSSLEDTASKINLYLDTGLESIIRTEIDKSGIYPDEVTVLSDRGDYFICELIFKQSAYKKGNEFRISKIIGDAVDVSMQYNGTKYSDDCAILCFSPRLDYSISTGYSTISKNGEKVCGDSFCMTDLTKQFAVILSDGMGSGEEAHKLSKYVCNMTKNYLVSGFDMDTCVKMVNSSLILKSRTDDFATLDMLNVNLCDGKVNIYKNGACPTYIKINDRVERIECSSLPAGVIAHTDSDKIGLEIEDNALFIMVSDGVFGQDVQEDWVLEEIKKITSQNPQIVANTIMEKAKQKYFGKIGDDITVIATAVWKN